MPERDPMTFETRLADAFDRYTAAAPTELASRDLVHLVVGDECAVHALPAPARPAIRQRPTTAKESRRGR